MSMRMKFAREAAWRTSSRRFSYASSSSISSPRCVSFRARFTRSSRSAIRSSTARYSATTAAVSSREITSSPSRVVFACSPFAFSPASTASASSSVSPATNLEAPRRIPYRRMNAPTRRSVAAARTALRASPLIDSESGLEGVFEPLRLGQGLQLLQRVVLDLPDPLTRDAERAADLLERARRVAVEAVAHLDHVSLPWRQRRQRIVDVLSPQRQRRRVERGLGLLVWDEVAERRLLLLADRLLERHRQLRHAQDLADLLGRHLELLRDLVWSGLPPEPLHELALDVHDLVQLLDHVHRNADRPRLVRDRARDCLADPPGRVGRELVALAVVEFLDGPDQPERPLLDEVEERQPTAEVSLGDRHDQAEVRLDHLRLRAHFAALDALGEVHLLVGRQQRHLPDLAQVEPQRVEARLDGQVELGRVLRLLLLDERPLVWKALVVLALDELHAVVDQVGGEIFELILRELDFLDTGDDLVIGEEALLLPCLDQLLQLLDVGKSDVDGEHVFTTSGFDAGSRGKTDEQRGAGPAHPPAHQL